LAERLGGTGATCFITDFDQLESVTDQIVADHPDTPADSIISTSSLTAQTLAAGEPATRHQKPAWSTQPRSQHACTGRAPARRAL